MSISRIIAFSFVVLFALFIWFLDLFLGCVRSGRIGFAIGYGLADLLLLIAACVALGL